jgi:hypothetical protein
MSIRTFSGTFLEGVTVVSREESGDDQDMQIQVFSRSNLRSRETSCALTSSIQERGDRAQQSVVAALSNESRNIPGSFSLFQNPPVPDPGPTSSTARNIR